MKIEASKHQSVERKDSKNVFKTESSVFNSSTPKSAETHPAASPSAVAKILEETRRDNEKTNSSPVKTNSGEPESKTSESERSEENSRVADEKKELEERNSRNGDGDDARNGDENQSPQFLPVNSPRSNAASETIPAARSILHIADLERIVSTIRTETFQNHKQVVIALKNSVLQGLQIRLTIAENGKLKAEFLALDEQIKKQLERRKKELSEILHNRSSLFSEIEVIFQK